MITVPIWLAVLACVTLAAMMVLNVISDRLLRQTTKLLNESGTRRQTYFRALMQYATRQVDGPDAAMSALCADLTTEQVEEALR